MARQKTRRPLTDEQREQRKAYLKAWHDAHPNYNRTYHATHRVERLTAMKDWRDSHGEHRKAYMDQWRAQHVEHRAAYAKTYWGQHPERKIALARAYMPGYYRQNKPAFFLRNEYRRARLRNAPQCDLTHAQWKLILAAYRHCCAYCGKRPRRLTKDHVIPLAKGGGHTASNIVPACHRCNSRKHTNAPPTPTQIVLPLL